MRLLISEEDLGFALTQTNLCQRRGKEKKRIAEGQKCQTSLVDQRLTLHLLSQSLNLLPQNVCTHQLILP